MEHGPFRLQKYAFGVNSWFEYSWNKIANIIYLETPSGVGFSYSTNADTGYNCSDNKTAEINYLFIQQFRKVFTQFNSNKFFLTGESYSGHYTPQLAQKIIYNDKVKKWNFSGLFIGNPRSVNDGFTGPNYYSYLTYLWSHALLPQTAYVKCVKACNWTHFLTDCDNARYYQNLSQECIDANNEAFKYVPQDDQWDHYDIYEPACHTNPSKSRLESRFKSRNMRNVKLEDNGFPYDPCYEQYIPEYMNRKDVLEALHVIDHYDKVWPDKPANWQYGTQLADVSSLYPNFFGIAPDFKITIYDGDADTAEPFMQEQRWINCLNQTLVKDFSNWYFDQDVSGSVKVFEGITFQTIKHCGHLVPMYCPARAYQVFYDFMNGTYSA